jgi:flagellar hook assembly protein FlgD
MSIAPITSGSNPLLGTNEPATSSRIPQQALGQEDFLKLLSVQFQSQDPMKPTVADADPANDADAR